MREFTIESGSRGVYHISDVDYYQLFIELSSEYVRGGMDSDGADPTIFIIPKEDPPGCSKYISEFLEFCRKYEIERVCCKSFNNYFNYEFE